MSHGPSAFSRRKLKVVHYKGAHTFPSTIQGLKARTVPGRLFAGVASAGKRGFWAKGAVYGPTDKNRKPGKPREREIFDHLVFSAGLN